MIQIRLTKTIINVIGSALLAVATLPAYAQTIGDAAEKSVTTIAPEKKVDKVSSAKIDTERFELGIYTGYISIQNFDSNWLFGIQGSYHIQPRLVANIYIAQSSGAQARFERELQGTDGNFIPNRDDGFQYMGIGLSYNLLNARSFSGNKRKYDSYISIDTAVENVEFAGESNIGLMIGTTYKTVLTDWLTVNISFKDHIVERSALGVREEQSTLTQNIEASLGFNVLF